MLQTSQRRRRLPGASARLPVPTLQHEQALWQQGATTVAGLDEVGRGPLAGPVLAAAVVLPPSIFAAPWIEGVRDSKLLSPGQREYLADLIHREALALGLGAASAGEIDTLGIVPATRRAMQLALQESGARPEHLLIDALVLPELATPQTALIHGDALCVSIACASIVAKVARDRLMIELDAVFPLYGFAEHKGYGTPAHLRALDRHGPSPIHRCTFSPVRRLVETGV